MSADVKAVVLSAMYGIFVFEAYLLAFLKQSTADADFAVAFLFGSASGLMVYFGSPKRRF